MGQAGSDVAKDASDIVLTDDNFASILNAIEEGRRMFDNIQKFILHLLAENVAQACTLLIGLAFKDSTGRSVYPLSPVEILWVIMITSGAPDMGLGMEIAAPDILQRPPQSVRLPFKFPLSAKLTQPAAKTRRLHRRSPHRRLRLRPLDGGPHPLRLLPRDVRLRRRPIRRILQRILLRRLRRRLPRARHRVRVSDVVRAIPRVGDDRHAPVLLPHAARQQEVLHAVGT